MQTLTDTLLKAQKSKSVRSYVKIKIVPPEGWIMIDTCDNPWTRINNHCQVQVLPGITDMCNRFTAVDEIWADCDSVDNWGNRSSDSVLRCVPGKIHKCLRLKEKLLHHERLGPLLQYNLPEPKNRKDYEKIKLWVKSNKTVRLKMCAEENLEDSREVYNINDTHWRWEEKDITLLDIGNIPGGNYMVKSIGFENVWAGNFEFLYVDHIRYKEVDTPIFMGNIAYNTGEWDLTLCTKIRLWVKIPSDLSSHVHLHLYHDAERLNESWAFTLSPSTEDWEELEFSIPPNIVIGNIRAWSIELTAPMNYEINHIAIDDIEAYLGTPEPKEIDTEDNRILSVHQQEQINGGNAIVQLNNYDGYFNNKRLLGSKIQIGWGAETEAGKEVVYSPSVWVISQNDVSEEGKAVTQLTCVDNLQRLKTRTMSDISPLDRRYLHQFGRHSLLEEITYLWDNDYYTLGEVSTEGSDELLNNIGYPNGQSTTNLLEIMTDLLGYTRSACKLRGDNVYIKYVDEISEEDYEYDTDHCFFSTSYGRQLTVPNRIITCQNTPRYISPQAYGRNISEEPVGMHLYGEITKYIEVPRFLNSQKKAEGVLFQVARMGAPYKLSAPMNVGQELYDIIKINDTRTGKVAYARVNSMIRIFEPGKYAIALILGGITNIKSEAPPHQFDTNVGRNFKGWIIDEGYRVFQHLTHEWD